ncbi:MAG: hypothetical protein ABSG75_07275 [Syntrophales bacterium]|jgi:chromosome segregation ATPase
MAFEKKEKPKSVLEKVLEDEAVREVTARLTEIQKQIGTLQLSRDEKREKIDEKQKLIYQLRDEISRKVEAEKPVDKEVAKIDVLKVEIAEREKTLGAGNEEMDILRQEERPLIAALERTVVRALDELKPQIEAEVKYHLLFALVKLVDFRVEANRILNSYRIMLEKLPDNRLFRQFWGIEGALNQLKFFSDTQTDAIGYDAFLHPTERGLKPWSNISDDRPEV